MGDDLNPRGGGAGEGAGVERTTEGSPVPPIHRLASRMVVSPSLAAASLLMIGPVAVALGAWGWTLPAVLLAIIVETMCVASVSSERLYKPLPIYQGLAHASMILDHLIFVAYASYRGFTGATAVIALLALISHAASHSGGRETDRILLPSTIVAGLVANMESVLGASVATGLMVISLGVGAGLAAATLIYRETAGLA